MTNITLEPLDLAALLCSRVCHDVISPVGAIVNGLEVMDMERDEATRADALRLVHESAARASSRLQFARLAFGAGGSAGGSIDLGVAQGVARSYFEDEKAELIWESPRIFVPKTKVKLILNLLLLANAAIPRGGNVKVVIEGDAQNPKFTLRSTGTNARVPAAFEHLVPGTIAGVTVDAQAVQGYYAGALARASGMAVTAVLDGADAVITAVKAPAA